ncbi:uncharacterized protein Bfra_008378 [Botrytis fragariae]|uniref:Uncharacterized protein n=1 Tax=Botrytis fragariae TaxID=1964551 RepID=A0A8H6ASQ0_9HELO|nr:uncharacterized protein Bfra_008378 [Botrytis fragariae]KAF5873101.1 hypothetical protein Bfra_008378 [Botrytis fragariae]
MSLSKIFNGTPVNYADVQPSGPPKPFTDQQPKANTIVFESTLTEKCWINAFPRAKIHSNEQATWSNGLARGDSKRRSD